MSNSPLDDFNHRLTYGNLMGPPRNAPEQAAQAFLDMRNRPYSSSDSDGGGGSYSVRGMTISFVVGLVILGVGLVAGSGYFGEKWKFLGAFGVLGGGLFAFFTGAVLALYVLKSAIRAMRLGIVLPAAAAAVAGWLFAPYVWGYTGVYVPPLVVAGGAGGVVALVMWLLLRRRAS